MGTSEWKSNITTDKTDISNKMCGDKYSHEKYSYFVYQFLGLK